MAWWAFISKKVSSEITFFRKVLYIPMRNKGRDYRYLWLFFSLHRKKWTQTFNSKQNTGITLFQKLREVSTVIASRPHFICIRELMRLNIVNKSSLVLISFLSPICRSISPKIITPYKHKLLNISEPHIK